MFPFIKSGEGSKIYDVDGNEYGIGMYETRIFYNTKQDIYELSHRYVGQFKDNKAEGIGIKTYFEGNEIYCGEYKNDERNGLGYWKYPSGAIFVGEHKNHKPDGFGMLITWDGFKFIGYVEGWSARNGKWYDQNNNEKSIIFHYKTLDITDLFLLLN